MSESLPGAEPRPDHAAPDWTSPSKARAFNRKQAERVLERLPLAAETPVAMTIRQGRAWRLGYAAAVAGLPTEARDYYSAENFWATARRAFRAGVVAAQCHGKAKP